MVELRLIHQFLPRFNRQGTRASKYPYIKLTLNERFPRLSVVRKVTDDGALYLGPVASTRAAKRIIEAIHSVAPVRRCGTRSRASPTLSVCAAAQLGVSCCPCSGTTSEADYAAVIEELVTNLTSRPDLLLSPLAARIDKLAAAQRYEEAADIRDRAEALAGLMRRQRRFDLPEAGWTRALANRRRLGRTCRGSALLLRSRNRRLHTRHRPCYSPGPGDHGTLASSRSGRSRRVAHGSRMDRTQYRQGDYRGGRGCAGQSPSSATGLQTQEQESSSPHDDPHGRHATAQIAHYT